MMNRIGCDWKRDSDKSRRFSMEFNSMTELETFFDKFLSKDVCNEVLNLRIWKIGGYFDEL